ncbi:single-stranded-DNA-specific exonuclease RecJ [Fundidesulfovibrio butyratiphilus]
MLFRIPLFQTTGGDLGRSALPAAGGFSRHPPCAPPFLELPVHKTWRDRAETTLPDHLDQLAKHLSVSPLLAGLMWRRGLTSPEAMDAFLCPGLRHLMQPDQVPGLAQAAEAVAGLIAAGKRLAVWGDYDVDGVTATALLVDFLRRRGYPVHAWHIPARLEEGYGLNADGLKALKDQGVDAVITVDLGVTAVEEARQARAMGLDLVITDHHLPGPELPQALAVANPKLGSGPGDDLAGVGVAFFLAAKLNRLLPGDPLDIRQFLDLAALGTLADVVNLRGQNRVLVKNGLLLIAQACRPGVMALKEAASYAAKAPLTASQVVFGLAPRINAAGRLGLADEALRLMLAKDLDEARPLAQSLETYNTARRREEETIALQAREQAAELAHMAGLVLYAPEWHSGVIGIVASRVVEAHYRPTLILTEENGRLKGSGRSIPEYDLHGGLEALSDLLLGFGGHRQAAGLSLAPENLPALRERFAAHVAQTLGAAPLRPTLRLDGELGFGLIDQPLLKELDLLSPFGCGNPEPVFRSPAVNVRSRRDFGKGHVFLDVRDKDSGVTLRAKGWRMAEQLCDVAAGQSIHLAFTPRLDTYNGLSSIELRLRDWRPGAPA